MRAKSPNGYRKCKRCGEVKPKTEFATTRLICNLCKKPAQEKVYASKAEARKAYYERHPDKKREKHIKQNARRNAKNPDYISREDRCPKEGYKVCIACREIRPLEMFKRKNNRYGGKCRICRGVNPEKIIALSQRRCKRCGEHLPFDKFEGKRRICIECAEKPISGYDVTEYSEKKRCQVHRYEARKKGLIANFTYTEWLNTKKSFNNKCAYCGTEHALSQDHFIPLVKSGEYSRNNIIPACHMCNSSKRNLDFFEWYPQQTFYSKKRESEILKHLNYKNGCQQLAI